MLNRFGDFDRTFFRMDELRRRMDRALYDFESGWIPTSHPAAGIAAAWPELQIADAGTELVLVADVPGLTDKDIELTLDGDTLTLEGERKAEVPSGYSVHRQERTGVKFSRSIALPYKIDGTETSATVKDGVLTVRLVKAKDALPRQIAVRAS